jgi:hypothetical protein
MTGNDFLDLASSLFAKNRSPNEALCRTIVSRAYYGAFHLARNYVVQLGFPETDSHRFLSDALTASGEPSVIQAGDFLRNLATARGRADYDLTKPNVIRQVQDAAFLKSQIERATDVKKNLLSLASSDEAKATARTGIDAFWRRNSVRSKN